MHGFIDDGASWATSGEYFESLADVTGGAAPIAGSANVKSYGIQFWSTTGGDPNATAAEGYATLKTPEELADPNNVMNKSFGGRFSDLFQNFGEPENWIPECDNLLDLSTCRIPALDFQTVVSDYNQNGLARHHAVDLVDLLAERIGQPGRLADYGQVNFVTHSAGGLDVRGCSICYRIRQIRRYGRASRTSSTPPRRSVEARWPNWTSPISRTIRWLTCSPIPGFKLSPRICREGALESLLVGLLAEPLSRGILESSEFLGSQFEASGLADEALLLRDEFVTQFDTTLGAFDTLLKNASLELTSNLPLIPATSIGLAEIGQIIDGIIEAGPAFFSPEQVLIDTLNNFVIKPLVSFVTTYPGTPKVRDDLRPYEAVRDNLQQYEPNLDVPQFVVWGEGGIFKQFAEMAPFVAPTADSDVFALPGHLAPPLADAAGAPRSLHAFGDRNREGLNFNSLNLEIGDGALGRTSALFLTDLAGGYMTALAGFEQHTHGSITLDFLYTESDTQGSFSQADEDNDTSIGEVLIETFLTPVTSIELSGNAVAVDGDLRWFRLGSGSRLNFRPQRRDFQDVFGRRFSVTADAVEYRVRVDGGQPTDWNLLDTAAFSVEADQLASIVGADERATDLVGMAVGQSTRRSRSGPLGNAVS